MKALDVGEISLLNYIVEIGLYYDTVNQTLAAERDFEKALADLSAVELLKSKPMRKLKSHILKLERSVCQMVFILSTVLGIIAGTCFWIFISRLWK